MTLALHLTRGYGTFALAAGDIYGDSRGAEFCRFGQRVDSLVGG